MNNKKKKKSNLEGRKKTNKKDGKNLNPEDLEAYYKMQKGSVPRA